MREVKLKIGQIGRLRIVNTPLTFVEKRKNFFENTTWAIHKGEKF